MIELLYKKMKLEFVEFKQWPNRTQSFLHVKIIFLKKKK